MTTKIQQPFAAQALNGYRKQLRTLADRLRDDSAALDEQTRMPAGGQANGGLSNAPMHLADSGSDEFGHDLNAVFLENETYLAGEAAAALQRIEAGTFGQCEECGGAIGRERLKAMPSARFCVQCSATLGAGKELNVNDGRPMIAPSLAPERPEAPAEQLAAIDYTARRTAADEDVHAAETPGGGSAIGGLAGTNQGRGDPDLRELQAVGGGEFIEHWEAEDDRFPQSGIAGGAVGGTPANKRSSRK